MKLSNVFTFALVAVALFISSASIAQGDHNELGFYVDQEMSATHVAAAIYTPIEVHIIITYPYNEDLNQPIESIGGIEFRSSFPSWAAFDVAAYWAADAVDLGNATDGHIVGFAEPLLNVDNAIYIGTKQFLLLTADPFGIYLGPGLAYQSIPDHMAIFDYYYEVITPLYPTSGSHDDPVFGVNMEVVATEKTTIGSLKALYR